MQLLKKISQRALTSLYTEITRNDSLMLSFFSPGFFVIPKLCYNTKNKQMNMIGLMRIQNIYISERIWNLMLRLRCYIEGSSSTYIISGSDISKNRMQKILATGYLLSKNRSTTKRRYLSKIVSTVSIFLLIHWDTQWHILKHVIHRKILTHLFSIW